MTPDAARNREKRNGPSCQPAISSPCKSKMSATIACIGVLRTPKELRSGVAKRPQGGCAQPGQGGFTANSQQADLGHRLSTPGGRAPADVVKVGLLADFTGAFATWRPQFQGGVEAYQALHGNSVQALAESRASLSLRCTQSPVGQK